MTDHYGGRRLFYRFGQVPRGVGLAQDVLCGVPGDHLTLVHVDMPEGFFLSMHSHENEQMMFVVSGRVLVTVPGREPQSLSAGDFAHFPANCPHETLAQAPSVTVEVFAGPARNEILNLEAGD